MKESSEWHSSFGLLERLKGLLLEQTLGREVTKELNEEDHKKVLFGCKRNAVSTIQLNQLINPR